MKTIELEIKGERAILLMKYLLKKKVLGWPFHYFLEPQLIIRTDNKSKIIPILKKLELKYKVYDFPYPKKGFGEAKKYKNYQEGLKHLYSFLSLFALVAKGKTLDFIMNRIHHCMLNMLDMDYYDESKYYLFQAKGYMKCQYKGDGKVTTYISYLLI